MELLINDLKQHIKFNHLSLLHNHLPQFFIILSFNLNLIKIYNQQDILLNFKFEQPDQ